MNIFQWLTKSQFLTHFFKVIKYIPALSLINEIISRIKYATIRFMLNIVILYFDSLSPIFMITRNSSIMPILS